MAASRRHFFFPCFFVSPRRAVPRRAAPCCAVQCHAAQCRAAPCRAAKRRRTAQPAALIANIVYTIRTTCEFFFSLTFYYCDYAGTTEYETCTSEGKQKQISVLKNTYPRYWTMQPFAHFLVSGIVTGELKSIR